MSDAAWRTFLGAGLRGDAPLVANADVTVHEVALAGERAPVVINRGRTAETSWVVSLRNAYGPYARAEAAAANLSAFARRLGVAASHVGETLLAAGGLSGGCYLDSWLIATELHAPQLTSAAVLHALDEVMRLAPRDPIVLRSLTPALHRELLLGLAEAGFLLLPTRQVWLVPDLASGAWRRRRDPANDLRLAAESAEAWQWIGGAAFSADDFATAHALYQQLYRRRYPTFNADYTVEFFRRGVASGFLEVTGMRPARGGPLQAVVGMVHRGGVSATPLLGYDLTAPQKLGLYRLASLHIWQDAERRSTLLHCSAGAGAFKESRGATRAVEFAAVWTGHLPRARRACLATLAGALRRWAVPYMERHRL